MSKLIFRGAWIRDFSTKWDEKLGVSVTVNFASDFTDVVREELEWGELPDGYKSGKLEGSCAASHFILTPNQKEFKEHELQMAASTIGSFEVKSVETDSSNRTELWFKVRSGVEGAAAQLEDYLRHIGHGIGQLKVDYERQSELPLEEAEPAKEKVKA